MSNDEHTSAEEWLSSIMELIPFFQMILSSEIEPRIDRRPGHAAIEFRNHLNESIFVAYDDGTKCKELERALTEEFFNAATKSN